MRRLTGRILAAIVLVLTGLTLILTVPTTYEGPLLLYINEQHAIRLVDAIGLILVVPSWLYLNLIMVRLLARWRRENAKSATDRAGGSMKAVNSLEFHKTRYAEEFVFDELRWSRIRPCLRMMQEEQQKRGRKLKVLDVGCGDGTVSRLFLETGNKVFGVDIVPEFVEKAIEKGIEARTADVIKDGLPFPEKTMDVIYAGAFIEHLYDPEFFLGECHRVLIAVGILILSTPNIASLTSRLRMLFGKGPKFYTSALSWQFGGHIRIFTAKTLKRLLEENGFAVEEMTSNLVSFVPTRLTRRPWSVRLGKLMPGLGEVLIVKARKHPLPRGLG